MGDVCGCDGNNNDAFGYMDIETMTRTISDQKEEDSLPLMLQYHSKDSNDILQWFDPGKSRIGMIHCIEIIQKNRIRVKGSGKTWQTMITDKIISTKAVNGVIPFKYVINELNTEFIIGWIDYNHQISETMKDIWKRGAYIGQRDSSCQHGVHIVSNGIAGKFLCVNNGKSKEEMLLSNEKYEPFQKGDAIEINLDYSQQICTVLYNGFIVGVAFKNQIADEIIPAISLHQTGTDITISL